MLRIVAGLKTYPIFQQGENEGTPLSSHLASVAHSSTYQRVQSPVQYKAWITKLTVFMKGVVF